MKLPVALDPGFGNTKVAVDGSCTVLQSVVSRPRAIGMAANGMRTVEVADQVMVGETAYMVGENAWQWGEPLGGLDYSSLAGEPRKALFYAALARLLNPGHYTLDLAIGLPVPLMQDREQYELLRDQLSAAYKGNHAFLADGGQEYHLEIPQLRLLAQPVGAWANWLLDQDGVHGSLHARKGGKDAEVAVLDIGLNTLDLYVIRGGQVEPRYVGGAKTGVRRILTSLNGHGQDLEEIDADLRAGRIHATREAMDSWMVALFGQIEHVWPDLRRFDAVIPVGGGALLLTGPLDEALIARGAELACPRDPITANALGLWKWLAYSARRQA